MSLSENEVNISDQPNFENTKVKQEHIEIAETALNEDPLNISHEKFSVPEKKNVVITNSQKTSNMFFCNMCSSKFTTQNIVCQSLIRL